MNKVKNLYNLIMNLGKITQRGIDIMKNITENIDVEKLIENLNEFTEIVEKIEERKNKIIEIAEKNKNTEMLKKINDLGKRPLTSFNNFIEEYEKLFDEFEKYSKTKKQQIKKAKFDQIKSSCFTSKLSKEIIKEHDTKDYKPSENTIISNNSKNDFGDFQISQEIKETDTGYILENYKTIKFSREEIQYYLALLNIYIKNILKKDYGIPFEFSIKDFHNNILGRKNRLRKEDLIKYESIFQKIRSKTIIYNPENATIKPFNRKDFKEIRINSNLINVDIVSLNNYKDQIIRIVPSALTMLELKTIKQFSNFLPVELLRLRLDKNDNILYFGLYLANLHKNNESHIVREKGKKPKRIYNKSYGVEPFISTIFKSLPNYKVLYNKYCEYKTKNNRSLGKLFFDREILNPLRETLDIFVSHGYIHKNYKVPEYHKDILYLDKDNQIKSKDKIKIIFNFDVGKLIEPKQFKKDEKKEK